MPLPRIALITLGGTIASVPGQSGGAVPSLDAEALAGSVPGIEALATIALHPFRKLPGAHLTTADLIELAGMAGRQAMDGVQGIVISQGTDTIEETAFALDWLIDDGIPIVVTGAMRGPTEPGADGPANLLGAVRVAASGESAGAGVVVLMDDTIHAARWVCKMHSSRPSAFSSPMTGPIGWVSEDRVTIALRPANRIRLEGVSAEPTPRVALLSSWLGDDGALILAAKDAGYDAMVVQGAGGGHVNQAVAEAIGTAAKAMPVVFASRVGSGEMLTKTYGFAGSEMDLIERGAIPAGPFSGTKARLLLDLLLRRAGTVSDAAFEFRRLVTERGRVSNSEVN